MDPSALFSVIVPTRDRPERLEACLEAMAQLDFPAEKFEVIISDDGSRVPSVTLAARFADRLRVRLVQGVQAGPAAARNRGAAQANGRFLAFTDDDCVVQHEWLSAYERSFTRQPDHLAAGRVVNGLPHNPFSTATQFIVNYVYAENEREPAGTLMFSSSNLAMRVICSANSADSLRPSRSPLEKITISVINGSTEAGGRCIYRTPLSGTIMLTWRGFVRQHFNYGRGLYLCRRLIAQREQTAFQLSDRLDLGLVAFPLAEVKRANGLGLLSPTAGIAVRHVGRGGVGVGVIAVVRHESWPRPAICIGQPPSVYQRPYLQNIV